MSKPTSINIDKFLSRIEYITNCRHCESKKTHYRRPIEKNTLSSLCKIKPPPVRKIDNTKNASFSIHEPPQDVKVNE